MLRQSERKLVSAAGLPGRPWYRHEIYAPGFYTGYAVKTLPAVREAIEQKKWSEVDADVATVAQILADEAALSMRRPPSSLRPRTSALPCRRARCRF